MLSTLCTTLLLAFAATDGGETGRWLAKLESNIAAERDEAQRWLAVHLELADFEQVHESAAGGGAESNRRLVSVLASSEKHFGLAALLGTDNLDEVANVGREALLELASTWSVVSEERGARRSQVVAQLRERAFAYFSFDPREHELAHVLELLTIVGDGGVMLVVDPDLIQSRNELKLDSRTDSLLSGNQAELLLALGRSYSFGFDGFGLDDEGDMAWMRVCRRVRAGKTPGRELLVDWVLRVMRSKEDREATTSSNDRVLCARALASSGWPAAIAWLETRWFEFGDEAALSGLRLLANRGLVSPQLRSAAVQAAWLDSDRVRGTLEETARALGALGRQSANGDDLEEGLLAGWEGLDAQGRWLRLVALEERGGESIAARELVLAVLNSTKFDAALAYQALRTAAELNMELGNLLSENQIAALLRYGLDIDGGREFTGLCLRTGVEPKHELIPSDWTRDQRLALCEWYFKTQDPELMVSVAGMLKALAQDYGVAESPSENELTLRLREWQRAGQGPRLAACLESLGPNESRIRALRLHLGLLNSEDADELAEFLLSILEGRMAGALDLLNLAGLAASGQSEAVLDLLVSRAQAELPSPVGSSHSLDSLNRALDEAVRVLREKRLDSQLALFSARIRAAGWPASWPSAPEPEALPLRLFERRFEP